jgi:hypothetical protein
MEEGHTPGDGPDILRPTLPTLPPHTSPQTSENQTLDELRTMYKIQFYDQCVDTTIIFEERD